MRKVPPGTYSIPSSAGASDGCAGGDIDFASAELIGELRRLSWRTVSHFIRNTAEELARLLCTFGRNAGEFVASIATAKPLVAGWRQPELFQRLLDREHEHSML
jgi:hypothetical protein